MIKTFIQFWSDLFTDPGAFFLKNQEESKTHSDNFYLAIIIFGIGNGIDRLDKQLTKYDLKGKLDDLDFLNNWIAYWIIAIIAGIIGGYLWYLVGGWFYNVRLGWSKGTSDIDKSRFLYLYSGVIPNSVIVVITIFSTIINDKPYDSSDDFNLFDLVNIVLILFFSYYSVYASYCGVRAITDVDAKLSKIWFLVLPVILYTAAYITIFVLLINYIS